MWRASSRYCKAQPFGIKWPKVPIKALGIYYTYDQKLLLEKNFMVSQLLFQFLWNGSDHVTRRSVIKMIDFVSMIISLQLAWLKRIISSNDGTWKRYLKYHLEHFGSLSFFCSGGQNFSSEKDWHYILWNNKQILINNKIVYYKSYFEAGVVHIGDLSFHLNNKDSLSLVSNRNLKTNFLVWVGLQHSFHFKN